MEEERILKHYFRSGFTYREILILLKENHDIEISLRTLERRLNRHGLRKKNVVLDYRDVVRAVQEEIIHGDSGYGYRRVHQRLNRRGLQVDRETVPMTLKELDPIGVENRKGSEC